MRHIVIRQDLNIEHLETHWMPLPQKKGIMSPEIKNTHQMARPLHKSR
jgi:hypothetical protein